MRLLMRTRGVKLSSRQLASAERRVRASLGRYAARIDRAVFDLGSDRGPRGGEGVRCRIEVRLVPKRVQCESTEASAAVALDIALARAARSIARALELGAGAA